MTDITYAPLFELFAQAISHKLKFPKLRLQIGSTTLVVKLNGQKSRYCGSIALCNDAAFGSSASRYYGRIEPNGGLVAGRDLTPEIEAFVQGLAKDPITVCAANGKLTGNCVFCQKALTDANSLAYGYGPVCAVKFSLPHAAPAKQSRKSRKQEVMEDATVAPTDQLLNADEVLGWSGKTKAQEDREEAALHAAGMDV